MTNFHDPLPEVPSVCHQCRLCGRRAARRAMHPCAGAKSSSCVPRGSMGAAQRHTPGHCRLVSLPFGSLAARSPLLSFTCRGFSLCTAKHRSSCLTNPTELIDLDDLSSTRHTCFSQDAPLGKMVSLISYHSGSSAHDVRPFPFSKCSNLTKAVAF